MHDTKSLMETATTPLERSVRISTLVADSNRDHLQVLVELGAQRAKELQGMATGPDFDPGVLQLADQVTETFEPEVPAFGDGDRVILVTEDAADPALLGKVTDRYLNEKGEWEYHVRHPKWGPWNNAYTEDELELAEEPADARGRGVR